MSSASRGLAPREGLECLADEDGPYRPAAQPHRGPQAGKSGDPRSQNADSSPRAQGACGLGFAARQVRSTAIPKSLGPRLTCGGP